MGTVKVDKKFLGEKFLNSNVYKFFKDNIKSPESLLFDTNRYEKFEYHKQWYSFNPGCIRISLVDDHRGYWNLGYIAIIETDPLTFRCDNRQFIAYSGGNDD